MILIYPLKRDKFVTQEFGENPDAYKQFKIGGIALKGHEGIDLRAGAGTQVVATDDGFAQEVNDQGRVGYGKYIKIVHDWGETVYAHLSEFKIRQGSQIKKGQVIGLSGATGNVTGAHLHFGVRLNPYNRGDGWGGYTDPKPLLFGETSTELDMPSWAKKLTPFFTEHGVKEDQIEGAVRGWYGDFNILNGFVEKWVRKFDLLEQEQDLGHVEQQMEMLLDLESTHIDLVSTAEQLVGHFETEEALRNALRGLKTDLGKFEKMKLENERLKQKRTLNRHTSSELFTEIINRAVNSVKGVFLK